MKITRKLERSVASIALSLKNKTNHSLWKDWRFFVPVIISLMSAGLSWYWSSITRTDNFKPTIAVSDIYHSGLDNLGADVIQKNSYSGVIVSNKGNISSYSLSLRFLNTSRYPGFVKLDNYSEIMENREVNAGISPYSDYSVKYFIPAGKEFGPIFLIPLKESEIATSTFSIPISYSTYDLEGETIGKTDLYIVCLDAAPGVHININCRFLTKK